MRSKTRCMSSVAVFTFYMVAGLATTTAINAQDTTPSAPTPTATPLAGTTNLAGKIETDILAYHAVKEASKQIAPHLSEKKVMVYSGDMNQLRAADLFEEQLKAIRSDLKKSLIAGSITKTKFERLNPSPYPTPTPTPAPDKQNLSGHKSTAKNAVDKIADYAGYVPSLQNSALLFADFLSLFRTDTTTTFGSVQINEASVVSCLSSVPGDHNLFHPDSYQQVGFSDLVKQINEISNMSNKALQLQSEIEEIAAQLNNATEYSYGGHRHNKTRGYVIKNNAKKVAFNLKAASDNSQALMRSLAPKPAATPTPTPTPATTSQPTVVINNNLPGASQPSTPNPNATPTPKPDEAGKKAPVVPVVNTISADVLVSIARASSVNKWLADNDAYILNVKVLEAGANMKKTKNLFTTFGAERVSFNGGAVVRYMLFNREGAVVAGDTIPIYTAYQKPHSIASITTKQNASNTSAKKVTKR